MHISELQKELEGVYKYAHQVIDVVESHRKAHHYSTRKLIIPICEVIENVPEILVNTALERFKAINPPPHPNYFKITCLKLMSDNGNFSTLGNIL